MKKLTFLGSDIDPAKEIEILHFNELGYKVTVQYSKDGEYSHLSEKPIVFNNVTEVHNLYDHNYFPAEKIAIESDIHSTGRNNDLTDIDWVTIEHSDKIEKCFSTYNH